MTWSSAWNETDFDFVILVDEPNECEVWYEDNCTVADGGWISMNDDQQCDYGCLDPPVNETATFFGDFTNRRYMTLAYLANYE